MKNFMKLLLPVIIAILFIFYNYLMFFGIHESFENKPYSLRYVIQMSLGYIVIILLLIFLYRRYVHINLNFIKLHITPKLIAGTVLFVPGVYLLFSNCFNYIYVSLGETLILQDTKIPFFLNFVIGSISSIVFAPILEEMVFRFLLISPFTTIPGKVYAVLISSTIFGFLHGYENFIETTIIGIIFSLIFLFTQNIIFSIITHIMINFTVTLSIVGYINNIKGITMYSNHNSIHISPNIFLIFLILSILGLFFLFTEKQKACFQR